jgi:hypothetical protein
MTAKDKEKNVLDTYAYTYEVNMIIQVLAEDEKKAKEQLDAQGGYVTSRVVNLKDSIKLFNGKGE